MRRSRMTTVVAAASLVALATVMGCGSSTAPLAAFQPQITNATDNFQFQATGVTNVTWTHTYSWSNSGDSATVNQATTISAGSATLTLIDPNGAQVYTQSLSANGTFGTAKGVTGNWTVKVVLTNFSGTLNFRNQKA